jgi:hypothetical protein
MGRPFTQAEMDALDVPLDEFTQEQNAEFLAALRSNHKGCNFYCCPSCHTDMRSEAHMAKGACE